MLDFCFGLCLKCLASESATVPESEYPNRMNGNRTADMSNTNHVATQRHLMAFVISNGWLLESQGNLFSLNEMRDGVK